MPRRSGLVLGVRRNRKVAIPHAGTTWIDALIVPGAYLGDERASRTSRDARANKGGRGYQAAAVVELF